MRVLLVGEVVAGLVLLPGCGGDKGPDIVCTTGMVADVVRNVAGERYTVGALMAAGVDPHLYEPRPGDARQLRNAKLVFYSGLHLEGKMTGMLDQLSKKKPVCAVTEGIP